MDTAEIESLLINALTELYEKELVIIQNDVAERTVCGQLCSILQQHFRDHSVHAEYNKHGLEPKEIEMPDANGQLTTRQVYPDLIVHKPGTDDHNLLVVEVKKSTNRQVDDHDLQKLARIKQKFGYRFAAFLRLPAGAEADVRRVRVIWA